MSGVSVAGIVLAAGASRRLGQAKQLLLDEAGRALVVRAAQQLLDAGCDPVAVMTGARHEAVADAVAALGVHVVFNASWSEGLGSSIRRGMTWLTSLESPPIPGAVLIAACDMPHVTAEHLRALIDRSDQGSRRVASAYDAESGDLVRGIPALFPQADWTVLHALSGDRGARDLFVLPDTLSVFLRNGSFDVDTPADLVRWRAESPPPPFLPRPMSALAQTALADLDHEIANTRRVLERVPADHLDFTPHAKSWPLQKLANHLTDFGMWGEITLATDVLDFAAPMPPNPPAPTTAEGFLAQFDERIARFKALLDQATDAQLMATWTMKNGDAVIMAMPRIAVLRSFIISHMIHHRAQLTIYFRLLDIPVPGLYGPSADEAM